jgi:hypothetical protein
VLSLRITQLQFCVTLIIVCNKLGKKPKNQFYDHHIFAHPFFSESSWFKKSFEMTKIDGSLIFILKLSPINQNQ